MQPQQDHLIQEQDKISSPVFPRQERLVCMENRLSQAEAAAVTIIVDNLITAIQNLEAVDRDSPQDLSLRILLIETENQQCKMLKIAMKPLNSLGGKI
jgi:hypothetical protein